MSVKYKIFNIFIYNSDEELEHINRFIAGHKVIDVEKHFTVVLVGFWMKIEKAPDGYYYLRNYA